MRPEKSYLRQRKNTEFSVNTIKESIPKKTVAHFKSLGHKKIGFIGEKLTTAKRNFFMESMKKLSGDIYSLRKNIRIQGRVVYRETTSAANEQN